MVTLLHQSKTEIDNGNVRCYPETDKNRPKINAAGSAKILIALRRICRRKVDSTFQEDAHGFAESDSVDGKTVFDCLESYDSSFDEDSSGSGSGSGYEREAQEPDVSQEANAQENEVIVEPQDDTPLTKLPASIINGDVKNIRQALTQIADSDDSIAHAADVDDICRQVLYVLDKYSCKNVFIVRDACAALIKLTGLQASESTKALIGIDFYGIDLLLEQISSRSLTRRHERITSKALISVYENAMTCLANLMSARACVKYFMSVGGVDLLLPVVDGLSHKKQVQRDACRLIANLCQFNDESSLRDERCYDAVVNAMDKYSEDGILQYEGQRYLVAVELSGKRVSF